MNILRKRCSMCYLASNSLSLLGNSVAGVILPLILLATTGDAFAAGLLAIICAIPQMLIGVLGGALLDRFNRRDVSIISDIISAASVAALPIVDMTVGLSFGWFVLLGLIGSVGDIPGMTARDTIIAKLTRHDGIDMQRYMGLSQSLESVVTIIGPAIAAGFVAFVGGTSALWLTAALSLLAALFTCGIDRPIGIPDHLEAAHGECDATAARRQHGSGLKATMVAAGNSLRTGLRTLFKDDPILRTTACLLFGLYIVIGVYQGLVLPVYFTEAGQPAMLGVMLSVMSVGMLAGSLAYTAFTHALRKRTWYVVSLTGMLAGIAVLGVLPPVPAMLAGGFVFGISAGPVSALLGFILLHRIPDSKRGCAMGTQNSLALLSTPSAVFLSSILVSTIGTATTSLILIGIWALVTIWALATRRMRTIDEEIQRQSSHTPENTRA